MLFSIHFALIQVIAGAVSIHECAEDPVPKVLGYSESYGTVLIMMLHMIFLHLFRIGPFLWLHFMKLIMNRVISHVALNNANCKHIEYPRWEKFSVDALEDVIPNLVAQNWWKDNSIVIIGEGMMDSVD
jgi:hypothetical protein